MNVIKRITFFLLLKHFGFGNVLKSVRVKTLTIFENCRMSGLCGMWYVGVFF